VGCAIAMSIAFNAELLDKLRLADIFLPHAGFSACAYGKDGARVGFFNVFHVTFLPLAYVNYVLFIY
jgi:hypothetical protein